MIFKTITLVIAVPVAVLSDDRHQGSLRPVRSLLRGGIVGNPWDVATVNGDAVPRSGDTLELGEIPPNESDPDGTGNVSEFSGGTGEATDVLGPGGAVAVPVGDSAGGTGVGIAGEFDPDRTNDTQGANTGNIGANNPDGIGNVSEFGGTGETAPFRDPLADGIVINNSAGINGADISGIGTDVLNGGDTRGLSSRAVTERISSQAALLERI